MIQAFILLFLVSLGVNCLAQQTTPTPAIQSDYLQKSKQQKTAAWILLGGGAALFTIGMVIPEGEEEPDTILGIPTTSHKNDGIKGALGLAGTVSMLSSIPLFIASGKNKRRALSASANLKMENAPVVQCASIVKRSYPALSIRIGL